MKTGKTTTSGKKSKKEKDFDEIGKRSIKQFSNLIKAIPIEKQAARAKREVWQKRFRDNEAVFDFLFPNDEIVISREDILAQTDPLRKIVMTLVWGYPTGGRGDHIKNILSDLSYLRNVLSEEQGKNLSKDELFDLIKNLEKVTELGQSTWSKLLYFFEIKVEGKRCQIFDLKIIDSLNSPQFKELVEFNKKRGISTWKQDTKGENKKKPNYIQFMNLLSNLTDAIGFDSDDNYKLEKVENFLFHYNLNFKF